MSRVLSLRTTDFMNRIHELEDFNMHGVLNTAPPTFPVKHRMAVTDVLTGDYSAGTLGDVIVYGPTHSKTYDGFLRLKETFEYPDLEEDEFYHIYACSKYGFIVIDDNDIYKYDREGNHILTIVSLQSQQIAHTYEFDGVWDMDDEGNVYSLETLYQFPVPPYTTRVVAKYSDGTDSRTEIIASEFNFYFDNMACAWGTLLCSKGEFIFVYSDGGDFVESYSQSEPGASTFDNGEESFDIVDENNYKAETGHSTHGVIREFDGDETKSIHFKQSGDGGPNVSGPWTTHAFLGDKYQDWYGFGRDGVDDSDEPWELRKHFSPFEEDNPYPFTEWRYYNPESTSIGEEPVDSALVDIRPDSREVKDMREAVNNLANWYVNPTTEQPFTSAELRVAALGYSDWTSTPVSNTRIKEIDYSELGLVIAKLEASDLVLF